MVQVTVLSSFLPFSCAIWFPSTADTSGLETYLFEAALPFLVGFFHTSFDSIDISKKDSPIRCAYLSSPRATLFHVCCVCLQSMPRSCSNSF